MRRIVNRLLAVLTAALFSSSVQALEFPAPLVETDWLATHSDEVVILDIRKDVKSFTAKPRFAKDKKTGERFLVAVGGHIPGARLVDYKRVRSERMIDGRKVDKMVPEKAAFEALMQEVGVNRDSSVVIVSKGESNGDMTMATRLYWQMKYFGHDRLAVLNGGVAQWIAERRPLSLAPSKPPEGDWRASVERKEILATSKEVAEAVESGQAQLVDTRPISLYLGTWKKSYVYDKGHIPGAKNFPNELMNEPGAPARFLPADQLRTLAGELGLKQQGSAITYCNSGHLASGGWFILSELLGNKEVKLYDGSMHQWTLEKRPVRAMEME